MNLSQATTAELVEELAKRSCHIITLRNEEYCISARDWKGWWGKGPVTIIVVR